MVLQYSSEAQSADRMYATRLLVVPRSIPTVRAICNLQRSFATCHQISNIGASIQQFIQPDHDSLPFVPPAIAVDCRVPLAGCLLESSVHRAELLLKILSADSRRDFSEFNRLLTPLPRAIHRTIHSARRLSSSTPAELAACAPPLCAPQPPPPPLEPANIDARNRIARTR